MKKLIILGASFIVMLTGCAGPQTTTQKGALYGTAGGAAAGAIIGQLIGRDTQGTLWGAAIGAAGRDVTALTGATINGRILAGAITAGTVALDSATVNVPAP